MSGDDSEASSDDDAEHRRRETARLRERARSSLPSQGRALAASIPGPSSVKREAPAELIPTGPRKRDRGEYVGTIYDRFNMSQEKHTQFCREIAEAKRQLNLVTGVLARCQNLIDPRE